MHQKFDLELLKQFIRESFELSLTNTDIVNYYYWSCIFLFIYSAYKLQRRGVDFNALLLDFILSKEDYFLFRRIGTTAYWKFRQERAKRESIKKQKLAWAKRKKNFINFFKLFPLFFKMCYSIFLKFKEIIRVNLIIFWVYFKKFCKNFSFVCYKLYCYSTVFAFPYVFPKIVALEICSLLTQQYFYVKIYIIKCYLKYFYTEIKNFFLSFKIINFIINTKVFIYICKFFKNMYHKVLVKLGLRKKTIKIKKWVKKKKKED